MNKKRKSDETTVDFEEKNAVEKHPKKPMSTGNKIVLVISIIVLVVSGTMCVKYISDRIESQKAASEIVELTDPQFDAGEPDYGDTVFPDGIQEKYKKAYSVNHNLVGWIKIPGTTVDHPVVHASDNNFYLRHNFYDQYERRGTLFVDYRNILTDGQFDTNTIIYGHNYLDSTMFSDVEKYKDIEFWKQNPVIEFNTIFSDYKWKVIAVFLTNADEKDDNGYIFNYIYPFMSDENYGEYFEQIAERSLYSTGIDVNTDDKILTLSTCTRDMDLSTRRTETNARCVVVARLVRNGESEAVDTSLAAVNENPHYPQIWYDKYKKTNPFKGSEKWYPKGVKS